MRICRLDLLRYGCFTDTVIELPANKPGIHIMFGPNEAGKSTALSALEDFLFGIPHNSPFNFLHDYGSMRIGAVLQKDDERLEARRRKGNRDTLLTPEEVPIPTGDGALAIFLAGADRSFFERMFSLDHERLRQGGREILEAQDEVGQMLFSAVAGIGGLRDRLNALEEEADALWASRRAAHRKYYQADDRLKAAENALHEHTVTASKWQELKRTYEAARQDYDVLAQEIEEKSAELRKLSRIRRVYRDIRRKQELDGSIAALGEVTSLPENARQTLEKAERDDAHAAARGATWAEQLEDAKKKRTALTYDEALLLHAEDIQQLNERRIKVRVGKEALPKRLAELASAESDLQRLAGELEWETSGIDQLLTRMPARSKVTWVRTLLSRRGKLILGTESAQAALEEAEARLSEIIQQLADMGAPVDVSKLAAVIRATRESGDITSRIKVAEGGIKNANAAIQRNLKSLKPDVSDEEALGSMSVPPRELVQSHRDERHNLDQRLKSCRERIRGVEQQLARHRKAHARVASNEHAILPEELARVRKHRDSGWYLIRQRYVEDTFISEEDICAFIGSEGSLSDAYEAAVREADVAADQRFDKAEAAARLADISRQIVEQEDQLEVLRKEEKALGKEGQTLDTAYKDMWTNVPFLPLSPDAMLEWITTRAKVLDSVDQRAAAERELAALRLEETEAIEQLLKEHETLSLASSSLKDQPLRVVLEATTDVHRRYEQNNETRCKLEEGLHKARADNELKRKTAEQARKTWSEWEGQWTAALSALGLSAVANHEAVAAQVDVIDGMRDIAAKVNDLRYERIGKIESSVTAFNRDVAKIIATIASDLAKVEPDDATLELKGRLDNAGRIRDLQKEKDESISSLEEKIVECEQSRREARETIRQFQKTAGVDNINDLKIAIGKSDSLRNLQIELLQVTQTLNKEGDGLLVTELQDECKGEDLDQITVHEEALSQNLTDLRERLMEARELRSQAQLAFEVIGGDDAAAKAAADRQAALAELKEVAVQYVHVRSAALLLKWAIERYRREKQAPLLRRAGQLFTKLTSGSFSDLALEFYENDKAHLIGLRPSGTRVPVKGMSTGTADQLFLALRVAAVEDYLERASPLPFVADDLFINFDDTRAAAGFEVLGQLAQKTQVLFFTHHKHLVEVACKTLGSSVSVIPLLQDNDIV